MYLCPTWCFSIWSYSHFIWVNVKGLDWDLEVRKRKGNDLIVCKEENRCQNIKQKLNTDHKYSWRSRWCELTHIVLNLIGYYDRVIYLSPSKHIDITLQSEYRQLLNSEKWVMDWLCTHLLISFTSLYSHVKQRLIEHSSVQDIRLNPWSQRL